MIGFSYNHLDNNYGVPPVDELVRIDLQQNRYDLKAELYEPFAWVEAIKLRFAYNDYQHVELEDGITVGTQFDNQGIEGRAELVHKSLSFIVICHKADNEALTGVCCLRAKPSASTC
jgi:iron complex outermembrane receptor protein